MANGKASIDSTFLLLGLGLGVGLLLAKARKAAAVEKVKPDAPDSWAKKPAKDEPWTPPARQPPPPAKQPGTDDAWGGYGTALGVPGGYGGGAVDTGKSKEPTGDKAKTDWGSSITVGGRAFAEGLSDFWGKRDPKILAAIQDGFHPPLEWTWITSSDDKHTCKIAVLDRPIAVGTANDFVRVVVDHTTAQRIADHFGCLLPTTKISDLAYQQAHVEIPRREQSATQKEIDEMATTRAMLKQHDFIEQQRAGRSGLLRPIGKEWIIANKLAKFPKYALQYGWHGRTSEGKYGRNTGPGGLKVVQPAPLGPYDVPPHVLPHVDYSSATTLVQPMGYLDGVPIPVEAILRDPALASLLSHEGPMTVFRHPAVPPPGQANV